MTREPAAPDIEPYLARFGYAKGLAMEDLWAELDRVWRAFGLDNRRPLASQDAGRFYGHPVWVLNGLFAEEDPVSLGHREAIADFLAGVRARGAPLSVADFGGGSGVLAGVICRRVPGATVDIIEPFPAEVFRSRYAANEAIRFREALAPGAYDVVIAQDVLEHLDDPIGAALDCVGATREGGRVIFASCFHPFIACHLPATFYLRHTFEHVLGSRTLVFTGRIPGALHAQVFEKRGPIDEEAVRARDRIARRCGPALNRLGTAKGLLREAARRVKRRVKRRLVP